MASTCRCSHLCHPRQSTSQSRSSGTGSPSLSQRHSVGSEIPALFSNSFVVIQLLAARISTADRAESYHAHQVHHFHYFYDSTDYYDCHHNYHYYHSYHVQRILNVAMDNGVLDP